MPTNQRIYWCLQNLKNDCILHIGYYQNLPFHWLANSPTIKWLAHVSRILLSLYFETNKYLFSHVLSLSTSGYRFSVSDIGTSTVHLKTIFENNIFSMYQKLVPHSGWILHLTNHHPNSLDIITVLTWHLIWLSTNYWPVHWYQLRPNHIQCYQFYCTVLWLRMDLIE